MLAEKYRPRTFEQVIGQDKVISGMRWYMDNATSGLVLLLTGPSGSGKTTLAECAARYWGCTDFDIHRIESAQCDVTTSIANQEHLPIPADPKWADKLVKYAGLNIRDQLNQLPARLLTGPTAVAA